MKFKPSRVLNEDSQLAGLNANDLVLIGFVFLILQRVFVPLKLEFLSLVLLGVFFIFLVGIRMNFRRRIIRDFSQFMVVKLFNAGFWHVG